MKARREFRVQQTHAQHAAGAGAGDGTETGTGAGAESNGKLLLGGRNESIIFGPTHFILVGHKKQNTFTARDSSGNGDGNGK